MRKFCLIVLFGFFANPAFAGQCYSPVEVQAEQLLRLHSELMVITVTCRQSSQGDDLVPLYTGFTKSNIAALHDAEQTMIKYYKTRYGGSGVDHLDKLRTRLGNEYGQKIADMSAPLFCGQLRDKVVEMFSATPARLETEVRYLTTTEKSYEHPCDLSGTHIAKKGQ